MCVWCFKVLNEAVGCCAASISFTIRAGMGILSGLISSNTACGVVLFDC